MTDDTYQYTARVDHQITNRQRIYGRWVMNNNTNDSPGYSPDVRSANETTQHNIGVQLHQFADAEDAADGDRRDT